MLSWQLQGRLEISSKWKISGLMFCFECYVLVRSTIYQVQLTLTPHWEVSNYVRASSSCGLMTLNVLLPTLTASPALRGPPPAQHQPEIIKLIKPDTAHTLHMSRRHGRKCGDSVLRRRFMAPATSGLLLLLGMFHKKNNLTRTNHKCKYFSWRG